MKQERKNQLRRKKALVTRKLGTPRSKLLPGANVADALQAITPTSLQDGARISSDFERFVSGQAYF